MREYANEYVRIRGEYARIRSEYARIRKSIRNEYARIRKNTQDMRRIRKQIFDDMQQICKIHTKILAKYARICDGYSQYAAVYLRMELVISVMV